MNGKRDLAAEKARLSGNLTNIMKNLRKEIKECEAALEIVWSAQEDANDGRVRNASAKLTQLHARLRENLVENVGLSAAEIRINAVLAGRINLLEEESNDGRE